MLYKNDLDNESNWLKVKLEGVTSKRDAFGSTIKIAAGAHSWVHEYSGGFGTHASQNTSIAHFGLGNAEVVDSLVITWPGSEKSYFENIPVNQFLKIPQDSIATNISEYIFENNGIKLSAFHNPFSNKTKINFQLNKTGYTEVEIFDALGRKINTLISEWLPAGEHSVDYFLENNTAKSFNYVLLKQDDQIGTLKLIHN